MARLGLSELVVPLRMSTVEASRQWAGGENIGLLFIDASHDYLAVRRDFEMWSPLVCGGGFVVFDDVPAWPGPTRVVSELPRWFRMFGTCCGHWIVQKAGGTAPQAAPGRGGRRGRWMIGLAPRDRPGTCRGVSL